MTRRTETDGWKSVWSSNPVRESFTHRFFYCPSVADVLSVGNHQIRSVLITWTHKSNQPRAGFYLAALHANQITWWLNVWICNPSCCTELLTRSVFCCFGVRTYSYPTASGMLSIGAPTHVLPPQWEVPYTVMIPTNLHAPGDSVCFLNFCIKTTGWSRQQ